MEATKRIAWKNSGLSPAKQFDPFDRELDSDAEVAWKNHWKADDSRVTFNNDGTVDYQTNLHGQNITSKVDYITVDQEQLEQVHQLITKIRRENNRANLMAGGNIAQQIDNLINANRQLPGNTKQRLLDEINNRCNAIPQQTNPGGGTGYTRQTNFGNTNYFTNQGSTQTNSPPTNYSNYSSSNSAETTGSSSTSDAAGAPPSANSINSSNYYFGGGYGGFSPSDSPGRSSSNPTAPKNSDISPSSVKPQSTPPKPKTPTSAASTSLTPEIISEVKNKNSNGENWTPAEKEIIEKVLDKVVIDEKEKEEKSNPFTKVEQIKLVQKLLTVTAASQKMQTYSPEAEELYSWLKEQKEVNYPIYQMVNAQQQQIEKSLQHLEQLKLTHHHQQQKGEPKLNTGVNWTIVLGTTLILGIAGLVISQLIKTKKK